MSKTEIDRQRTRKSWLLMLNRWLRIEKKYTIQNRATMVKLSRWPSLCRYYRCRFFFYISATKSARRLNFWRETPQIEVCPVGCKFSRHLKCWIYFLAYLFKNRDFKMSWRLVKILFDFCNYLFDARLQK